MEKTISAIDHDRDGTHRLPRTPGESRGLVPSVVHLGADVAATGVTTSVAIVNELRTQSAALAVQGIGFVESLVRGLCEAGRRITTELDRAGAQATVGVERVALSTIGSVKTATDQAAQLATSTVDAVVGRRAPGAPGAAAEPAHN